MKRVVKSQDLINSFYLRTSLFVVILMSHAVDFQAVTFQGAALCEGFLTKITFVRSNACKAIIQTDYFFAGSLHPVMRGSALCVSLCFFTCMCPSVSLQVESVVESLATKGTEVSFHVAVALHVSIEQSL